MLEYTDCNLCGENNYEVFSEEKSLPREHKDIVNDYLPTSFSQESKRIVGCKNCGLLYTNPRLSEREIKKIYQSTQDPFYINQRYFKEIQAARYIKEIGIFKRPPGRILDIGCYAGFFLKVAQKRGWQVSGLEPSLWAVDYARRDFGLEVTAGFIEDIEFKPGTFDVITMYQVIEHLTHPLEDLTILQRVLKKDGLLVIETPDIGSFFARLFKRHWWFLMEMHNFYFTLKPLICLLKKTGFDILKVCRPLKTTSFDFLIHRMEAYRFIPISLIKSVVKKLALDNLYININLRDMLLIYASKR